MNILNCGNGCCVIHTSEYTQSTNTISDKNRQSKSGILLYDIDNSSILLIQSKGNLWGIPKGTVEQEEDFKTTAVRELLEETGIHLTKDKLSVYKQINNNCRYFFVKYKKCDVKIQSCINNDANSIGWVKINCLKMLIKNTTVRLNKHTCILLLAFLNFRESDIPYN